MSEFRGSVLSIDQGELRGKTSRFLLNRLEKPEISRLQWNHENCKHRNPIDMSVPLISWDIMARHGLAKNPQVQFLGSPPTEALVDAERKSQERRTGPDVFRCFEI